MLERNNNFAALAQLVEHHHGKVGVAGSSPAGGFQFLKKLKKSLKKIELSVILITSYSGIAQLVVAHDC